MRNRYAGSVLLMIASLLLFAGFKSARMRLPDGLPSDAPALAVEGKNPRVWNRPIGFGPYRTVTVREGVEFSWSVKAFGVRGGMAKQRYRLALEGPGPETWEVECLTRSIEAWRDGLSVDLTGLFQPRLVCGLHLRGGEQVLRLVLGARGREMVGVVEDAEDGRALFGVRSIHHVDGSRISSPEPLGYALEQEGSALAAVETVNRGRVWLAAEPAGAAAAAAAALLLFNPELSPEE